MFGSYLLSATFYFKQAFICLSDLQEAPLDPRFVLLGVWLFWKTMTDTNLAWIIYFPLYRPMPLESTMFTPILWQG